MNHKVIVSEGSIVLPTYDLKEENRNPVFRSQYGVAHIYPYTLQDHIDFEVKDKQYKALFLENAYLKVSVIPDLGGRVYSVYDKISEREVFYKNSVVKFSPLAIRGAFFSGGVEFSFPVAHAPTTCDPVNWAIHEHDDGSASVSFGGSEHISGLQWMITLTLYPDRCALSQDVYLKNPNNFPGRYHYWTNASLDADELTEFVYPFHRSRSYEYAGSATWPNARIDLIQDDPILPGMEGVPMWPANNLQEPINFRWQKNMLAQVSIFGRDIEWDYFGAWQHSVNHGYAHIANPKDVSGMKLWSWGNLPVGVVNQTALTDDGSEYAETQCGAMETQLDFDFMRPYESRRWREWWLPLRGMGGLTCASEHVGVRLNFSQTDGRETTVTVAVCPVRNIKDAILKLSVPDRILYEAPLDTSPEKPWQGQFVVDAGLIGDQPITLTIIDAQGNSLIHYENARQANAIEGDPQDDNRELVTSLDYFLRALNHENFDNRAEAKADYQQAIDLDPTHGNAHLNYGKMLLRSAQFEQAKHHLQKAEAHGCDDAAYYRGIIALYEDMPDKARQHFDAAIRHNACEGAATVGLAKLALRDEQWNDAVALFKQAMAMEIDQTVVGALLAAALRCSGQHSQAEQTLRDVLHSDPLSLLANYELDRLQSESTDIDRLLGDDYQYFLDLACEYLELGLLTDAKGVLDQAWAVKHNVMVAYLLAYVLQKAGEVNQSAEWLVKARSASLDYAFPSRLGEVVALQSLLEHDKTDDHIRYLLAIFYYAHERYADAKAFWEDVLTSLDAYDVLHRNLGVAYWQQFDDPQSAIEHFEKALDLNPLNQDLYLHLDDLYADLSLDGKREQLLEKIGLIPDLREDIRKRKIKIMVDLGQYEVALQIMSTEGFLPLEMDQSFHDLENLGVGRPTMQSNAQIYYLLGCAYEKTGNYTHAVEAWYQAAAEHHHSDNPLFKFVQMSLDKINRYSELGMTPAR